METSRSSLVVSVTVGVAFFATAALATSLSSAPETMIGGQGTVFARGADAFSMPARNATKEHRHSFVIGNALFKENWVATPASVKGRQGLGPNLNAQSCSTCHFKDGRGQPPLKAGDSFSSMLVRISVPGQDAHGGPKPVPNYGDQINHRAIVGVKPEGNVKVVYEETAAAYPDGSAYALLVPKYRFEDLAFGDMPADVMLSPRVAPQVIGLGLLEAIPEKTILAMADPDDRNGDGISGRANQVWDLAAKKKRLGRFGWKANQPSLAQQNAGAFNGDMGITSRHFPNQGCAPLADDCKNAPADKGFEISDQDLKHMETYMRIIAVPARRDVNDPQVLRGEAAFRKAQCNACHVESYTTGKLNGFPELSFQTIRPYTDLLLHDLGPGLADGRPDFEANGNEWRTPPLWGVGLFEEANGHTRYLHDGRARNLEEAILWHGGEAEQAKKNFVSMEKSEREALVRFLKTL